MFKNEKFEATGETKQVFGRTLYRIRAVAAIAALGVMPGDSGGWIEKEQNLSVFGNAWVSGNAQVSDNALVYGNARVYGDARVYGNAQVSGNAWVYDNALVYGNARVYGDARVFGNAWVSGNARVYGNAQVSGNAWVYDNALVYGNAQVSPVFISGLRWSVTIVDTQMTIGCQSHALDAWWKFSDRQIQRMDSEALEFWKLHKTTFQAICAATNRPSGLGQGATNVE